MTNYTGSPGVPDLSMPTGATGFMPRRSSYASVVSGVAPGPSYPPAMRSGAFSHLLSQHTDSSFDPAYQTLSGYLRNDPRAYDMDFGANGSNHGRSGSWTRGGQLPSFSSAFGSLVNGYGYAGVGGNVDHFFVPSYLKGSKYVQKLEEAHRAKATTHRDGHSAHSSQPGSLSTSSSSVNMHPKMAPSHRGMTYDVIEKAPPMEDESLPPLPSRWNEKDKHIGLEVLSEGQEVKFAGAKSNQERDHEASAIRADHPMPPQCGIYYYEVTIVSRKREESSIGIGFSSKTVPLSRLPGWEPDSWAYHGDDGHSFCCQSVGKQYGPPFNTGDVIGCGVNFRTGSAFFTKNGDFLGPAFRDINNKGKLYPSIGMKKSGEYIRVNFGQSPFVFDIDGMMSASNNSSYLLTPPPEPSEDGWNVFSDGSASMDYPTNDTTTGFPQRLPLRELVTEPALGDRLASSNPDTPELPPMITPPWLSPLTIWTRDEEARNYVLPVDEQLRPLRLPSTALGLDFQVPTDEGLIEENPQEEPSRVVEMRSAMQRLLVPMSNSPHTGVSQDRRISMYQTLQGIAPGLYIRLPLRPEDGNRSPRLAATFHVPGLLAIGRSGVPNTTSQTVKPRDISTMTDFEIQQERLQIRQDIEATSTSKIAPPLSETELIQSLVLQFLTHDGYVDTARAFADEVHAEKKALSLDPNAVVHGFDVREDEDAGHRQRIRAAVLEGDVDKALKYTNAYYPHVLKDNEHVYFRLRCRKFIEMIRQGAELQNAATNGAKRSNGHNGDWYDDILNHDMELDDHQSQANNWDRMDTEESLEQQIEYQRLLDATLTYGRDLQAEFKDDQRREVSKALEDAFALMAYSDPLNAKEVSHLLDPSGRLAVAEELNSAILQSLGKSSSAALEQLYQQTTILLEDLREGGGPGAFVNIDDFVRPK